MDRRAHPRDGADATNDVTIRNVSHNALTMLEGTSTEDCGLRKHAVQSSTRSLRRLSSSPNLNADFMESVV